MSNRTVVQWDKDDCADLGIVKIDLLGLGMLAVLQDCIEVVRRDYGDLVDLAHLPQKDPEVYDALQKALRTDLAPTPEQRRDRLDVNLIR